jgi:predicted GNAT superfamily acetyltransferase
MLATWKPVVIRDLAAPDLAAIHTINEAGTPGVTTATVEKLGDIRRESSIALVAEVGGVVSAFCLVLPPGAAYASINYRWFSERYDDFIYLDRVAVAVAHRGRGIGSQLYAEVERRSHASWFTLEVNLRPRNDGSLRYHERHGFVEVGQQETDYGTLVSLLAKRLR